MRGSGRAAAAKNAKQNTTEMLTQEMSTIAMLENAAFRVPHLIAPRRKCCNPC